MFQIFIFFFLHISALKPRDLKEKTKDEVTEVILSSVIDSFITVINFADLLQRGEQFMEFMLFEAAKRCYQRERERD